MWTCVGTSRSGHCEAKQPHYRWLVKHVKEAVRCIGGQRAAQVASIYSRLIGCAVSYGQRASAAGQEFQEQTSYWV